MSGASREILSTKLHLRGTDGISMVGGRRYTVIGGGVLGFLLLFDFGRKGGLTGINKGNGSGLLMGVDGLLGFWAYWWLLSGLGRKIVDWACGVG